MLESTSVTTSDPINLTLLEAEFLDQLKEQGKSTNTLKNYKTDLECFNKYIMERQNNLIIQDFNLSKVEEYGQFLNKKYTADNSRRRRVQALRIFFDFLVKKNLYTENPVRKLPTSPKFLDVPRPTPLKDIQTLWAHLCKETKNAHKLSALMARRNQIVVLLVYGAALKVSDLAKLQMDHVMDGEDPRVLVTPPRRDPYSVQLPNIFNPLFTAYKDLLNEVKSESHIAFSEVLFNANPYRILSGGLSPRGLEIIFEELRKKLGLTLTPKSLRQACIFKWLGQNKNETLIKEWMGVAPSYSLKLYRTHQKNHLYEENFLETIYRNHLQ